MRTSEKKLNSSLKKQIFTIFVQTFADLKTTNETEEFIKDFFTDAEIEIYAKRLAIAYWLKKGRSYTNIKENLKASSATIASVQDILGKKGIESAIKKLEAGEWANQWAEKINKVLPNLKRV